MVLSGKTLTMVAGGLVLGALVAHARRRRATSSAPVRRYRTDYYGDDSVLAVLEPIGELALPARYVGCEDEHRAPLPDARCAWIRTYPGIGDKVEVPLTKSILMDVGRFTL